MFDKEAQRRRAAELSAAQLAAGAKPVSLPPVPVAAKLTPDSKQSPWPFAMPSVPAMPPVAPALKAVVAPKKEKKVAVNYSAEPFTNEIGQTIQPGDKIVCVTQGYNHSVKVSPGVYLGLRRDHRGGVRNVVVRRTIKGTGYQINGKKSGYRATGATWGSYTEEGQSSLPSKRVYLTK